jgi:hypothetical protein
VYTLTVVNREPWHTCLRLVSDAYELLIPLQFGIRILHFGWAGGENLFWTEPSPTESADAWRVYGGHRLWHAPEHPVRTYSPDNDPIEWHWDGQQLLLRQPTEPRTGIRKEVVIAPHANSVQVRHRLVKRNLWAVQLAAWALSVMRPSGVALIPQEPYRPHPDALLPVRRIALWAYTDMSDPRLRWGKRLIQVHQDPTAAAPLKIGVSNTLGWMAYWLGETLFVKRYAYDPSAEYPDLGCNTEVFTNAEMLELETLSPLIPTAPPEFTIAPLRRFPPLREGNRAGVRFPLLAGGTCRRGSSTAVFL